MGMNYVTQELPLDKEMEDAIGFPDEYWRLYHEQNSILDREFCTPSTEGPYRLSSVSKVGDGESRDNLWRIVENPRRMKILLEKQQDQRLEMDRWSMFFQGAKGEILREGFRLKDMDLDDIAEIREMVRLANVGARAEGWKPQ